MKRYIKLFESWQSFNKSGEDTDNEREYRVTVNMILTWAVGPDWSDDWNWMPDILMVDDEFPEDDDCIGYLELLKNNRDLEVDVYSQNINGQIDSSWFIEDTVFDLITWEWPFEEDDNLGDIEQSIVRKLVNEIGEDGLSEINATTVDIIDFVDWSSGRGKDLNSLTLTGFRNWLELHRGRIN